VRDYRFERERIVKARAGFTCAHVMYAWPCVTARRSTRAYRLIRRMWSGSCIKVKLCN